jgi:hypothetical protein
MPAGEYIVNVHMYRGIGVSYPVAVKLVASVKATPDDMARQIVATTVNLRRENDQITAFRFRLDEKGQLVAGSINSLFKELRVASQ